VQRGHQRAVSGFGRAQPHLRPVAQLQGAVGTRRADRGPHLELRGELQQRGGSGQLGGRERPRASDVDVLGAAAQRVDVARRRRRRVDQAGPQHRGHGARCAARVGHHHPGEGERGGGGIGQLRGVGPHQQRARDARGPDRVDQRRGLDVLGHVDEQLVGDRAVVGRLADDVEGEDVAPGLADRGGQPAESTGPVLQLDVHPPQCHDGQRPPALFPIRYRCVTGLRRSARNKGMRRRRAIRPRPSARSRSR
jgi:hypothetical protein